MISVISFCLQPRPGVITDFRLAPSNVHELQVTEDLFEGVYGWVLDERNYWSLALKEYEHRFFCQQVGLPPLHFADLILEGSG